MKKLNTILLIDDDAPTNFFNKIIIKKANCAEQVDVTQNGLIALEYIKANYNENKPQPDLILLDINLPGMNGWEFLEEYSKLEFVDEISTTIIIMLTTSLNPSDMEKANSIKVVNGFANKPFSTNALEEIINNRIASKAKELY